jgi:hypothetical protein
MTGNSDRQQLRLPVDWKRQIARLVLSPLLEHLIRLYTVQACNLGNTRPGSQRLFHNPPLLLNGSPTPAALSTTAN